MKDQQDMLRRQGKPGPLATIAEGPEVEEDRRPPGKPSAPQKMTPTIRTGSSGTPRLAATPAAAVAPSVTPIRYLGPTTAIMGGFVGTPPLSLSPILLVPVHTSVLPAGGGAVSFTEPEVQLYSKLLNPSLWALATVLAGRLERRPSPTEVKHLLRVRPPALPPPPPPSDVRYHPPLCCPPDAPRAPHGARHRVRVQVI